MVKKAERVCTFCWNVLCQDFGSANSSSVGSCGISDAAVVAPAFEVPKETVAGIARSSHALGGALVAGKTLGSALKTRSHSTRLLSLLASVATTSLLQLHFDHVLRRHLQRMWTSRKSMVGNELEISALCSPARVAPESCESLAPPAD